MEKPSSGKDPSPPARDGEIEAAPLPATDAELLAECRVETFRAGGKGGQHQNKTESGVRLKHRPSGMAVTVRDSRSQLRNKQVALERLRLRLEARMKTKKRRVKSRVPLKEKKKRVDDKKKKSTLKRLRKSPNIEDV